MSTLQQHYDSNAENRAIFVSDSDKIRVNDKVIEVGLFQNRHNVNLNNPDARFAKKGFYLDLQGKETANASMAITGYIKVIPGKTIKAYNNNFSELPIRFISIYNSAKTFVSASENQVRYSYVIPDGIAYVRVSYSYASYPFYQVCYDGASVYREKISDPGMVSLIADSSTGKSAKRDYKATIAEGESIIITDFAYHLKKGLCMSISAEFSSFAGEIKFGKGFGLYRGDWLVIDGTKIYWKHYESAEATSGEIAHGLTISTFIKCALYVDRNSVCNVVLSTLGGYFKTTFNWGFEANHAAFMSTTGQNLTNVCLNCTSKDFQYPVWIFGDSYVGVSVNRWTQHLKDMGYFNFMLNGIAGQSSAGAYADFVRCLRNGTPKYLVWLLGMNDELEQYSQNLNLVMQKCEQLGIVLILATIPSVPDRIKTQINATMRASGCRFIDIEKSVGANSSGVWYAGYLDADNVHPTAMGAKAIAAQFLVDAPEIMQYGMTDSV